MANLNDLKEIALSFPETVQEEDRIAFAVMNKGKPKGFAWVWMERINPKGPKIANLDVVAIRVRNNLEKDMLIESEPDKFFTEPHYNSFPAVLVRLNTIDVNELKSLLSTAWRCQAPKNY
jgi:hypothetical protein